MYWDATICIAVRSQDKVSDGFGDKGSTHGVGLFCCDSGVIGGLFVGAVVGKILLSVYLCGAFRPAVAFGSKT